MDMNFAVICEGWKNRKLPIFNGIAYSDGYVDRFNVDYDENNNYKRILINNGRTRIDSLLIDADNFSYASIYGQISNEEKRIIVIYGGGSYGGDGFIVVESFEQKIIWLAVFEDSNEFEHCEILENSIIAWNNSGEKWVFDVDCPSNLRVVQTQSSL